MEKQAKQLFVRYAEGNDKDFPELVRLISGRFFRMFYHMGADRMTAEDMCQEFFSALHRGKATFRTDTRFLPWAYSIARNIYYRHMTDSSRIKVVPIHPGIAGSMTVQASDELGIAEILAGLSVEKRIVFELKHFQELKFSEIAKLLDIPEGTVKSRMFNAIREIKEILSRRMK